MRLNKSRLFCYLQLFCKCKMAALDRLARLWLTHIDGLGLGSLSGRASTTATCETSCSSVSSAVLGQLPDRRSYTTLRSPCSSKIAHHMTDEQQFESNGREQAKEKHPSFDECFLLAAPDRLELTTLRLTAEWSTDWAKGQCTGF